MSDRPEDPQQTPIDRKVDQKLEQVQPPKEKYSAKALGNLPIADRPTPPLEEDITGSTSLTIAQIERQLASGVLKPSSIKTEKFAQTLSRKSDFRLRTLTQQLGEQILQDQTTSGQSPTKKPSEIELQSQTMRMVAANAAMGSYQFQKTLVLPYMRKNLALGYQKVSLLKEISKGIRSVETSLVSKLEAIKINTSSAAPRQKSYFKRLMDDVSFLNMRRVAGNLSAYTMDGYEKLYKKYVSPATLKIHRMMSSGRRQDGINGVRRSLTGKLNSLRRAANDYAGKDFTNESTFSKVKGAGATVASKILGGSVKAIQSVRLGDEKNRNLTGLLRGPAEDLARFNPFSTKGPLQIDLEDDGVKGGVVSPTIAATPEAPKPIGVGSDSLLTKLVADWRAESQARQDRALAHLARIDDGINGIRSPSQRSRRRASTAIPPIAPRARAAASTIDDIVASLGTPSGPKHLGDMLSGPLRAEVIPEALPKTPAQQARDNTSIGTRLREMRRNTKVPFFDAVLKDRPTTVPAATGLGDPKLNRHFFSVLFDRLGSKVATVSEAVIDGNKDRTKFEKVQTKWKEIADKLRPKAIRKNSYEDLQAQKKDRKGFVGRTAERFKGASASAGAKLLSGDVIGAGSDLIGDLFGWAKDEVVDKVKEKATEVAEEAVSRNSRRLRARLRRGGIKGLFRRGARGAPAAPASRTLGRRLVGGTWRLARRSTGVAGRVGWGLTKGAGRLGMRASGAMLRGGFSLAKGLAPAAAVGLAGDYADKWFSDNTSGVTQRLGKTAGKAASWGASGAAIGSIIPGLGTGVGAAVGASLGALAANTDLLSSGLSKLASSVSNTGDTMWTSVFGQKAEFDYMGRVKTQEKRSLLGSMYGTVFGQDAKYAKSGDLIRPGKTGLIPSLYKGIDKFFFGEKNKDGQFKSGTSILAMMGSSVMASLDTFRNAMGALPGEIKDLFTGLKEKASELYSEGQSAVSGFWASVTAPSGDVYKGKGTPVSDAKSIVQQLVPEARITSHRRPAGGAGKAGANSWHVKSGAAVDVAPVDGMDFETFKKKFTDAGYPLIEAIDETNAATMAKTGATGKHWHIVLGERTAAPNASAGYQGPNGTASWAGATAGGVSGPMKAGYVSGDAKKRFNQAVAFYMKRGWSKNAAMGIAANLFGESGLDPTKSNSAGGGRGAWGIAQWRTPRLEDIQKKFGKEVSQMSFEEQLAAVDWELRDGKHVTADKSIANGSAPIVDALNNAPNMEEAVRQMIYRYERPDPGIRPREVAKRTSEGYALAGGGQSDNPAETAQKAKQTGAANQAKAAPPKPTKTPTAPAAVAKPKPTKQAQAPTPVTNSSFVDQFSEALDKWSAKVTPAGTSSTSNTVIAPQVSTSQSSGSRNGISLKKERVRTGA